MQIDCKVIKDAYHYHLKVQLKDYIVQDCNHSDAYRERLREDCCNSHKYRGQDIRKQLRRYY